MGIIKDFIDQNDDFGIICHKSPDGDTLGSGLAMFYGLKQLGKRCNVYCADVPERVYSVLDGIDNLRPLDELKEKNLIFCDCSDEERAAFKDDLKAYNILNIDHHVSNTDFGNVNLVKATASATCEVIYDVFIELGIKLDKTIAQCLYVGICTDTNNFTNSNVGSNTFFVMSEIAKFDFAMNSIVKSIFRTKSLAKTKATALVINNIRMFCDGKICLSYLTYDDIIKLDLDNTEGLVEIGADIENVSVSVFLKGDENGGFKISLRSNYDVDVRKICEAFGGGGHVKASGCRIQGSLDQVIAAISDEVIRYMEK